MLAAVRLSADPRDQFPGFKVVVEAAIGLRRACEAALSLAVG
jgi:hypothetical protein